MRSAFVLTLLPLATAFTLSTAPIRAATVPSTSSVTMGMFDGFSKAFENDSTLGARQNAGLTKEKAKKKVTWIGPRGKKEALAIPGQKLKEVARSCGIPIRYDCQEGTCKTCEAQLSPGGKTKICVARMPAKDVTIKYNLRF